MTKTNSGRFFEDYKVGDVIRHAVPRTVAEGEREVRLYWKIDLYDAGYEFGSDDCADTAKTRRVLTILLPEEY